MEKFNVSPELHELSKRRFDEMVARLKAKPKEGDSFGLGGILFLLAAGWATKKLVESTGGTLLKAGREILDVLNEGNALYQLRQADLSDDPSIRVGQEKVIIEAFLNRMAANMNMSRANYDQYISTKIGLDAQIALEKVQTANEIAKTREDSLKELRMMEMQHYAELGLFQERSIKEIVKEEITHKFAEQKQFLESLFKNKDADLSQEREQKKKDQELKRDQEHALWDKDRQIQFVRDTDTLKLNNKLTDLRRQHAELWKERDELEEEKSDKPSWISRADRLDRQIKATEAQMDGIEAELHQGSNG